jgi:hypothetical protein
MTSSGVQPLALPPHSPNLNALAERWVCSVRQECLSKLILFGQASLRRALTEYIDHHFERNQGKGNLLLFPSPDVAPKCRTVHRRDRMGGLLKLYSRVARYFDHTATHLHVQRKVVALLALLHQQEGDGLQPDLFRKRPIGGEIAADNEDYI